MEAKQVPLIEQLASVPADARLVIDDADGMGTRYIPVGRLCHEAAAAITAIKEALAQPEQESFSPEAISATQAAWKMGYDAAKAEQPEQEPVPGVVMRYGFPTLLPDRDIKSTDVRLYTTPPQRTWVGLMDEQIDNVTRKQVDALLDHIYEYGTAAEGIDLRVRAVARAIEAKLKEKNA